jgi:ketosteroid isomerase-like protein
VSHTNEDLIRRLYKAFASQNMPMIDQLLADDIEWHTPGRARNAGTRRGKPALYAVMGELAQLTGGTLTTTAPSSCKRRPHAVTDAPH